MIKTNKFSLPITRNIGAVALFWKQIDYGFFRVSLYNSSVRLRSHDFPNEFSALRGEKLLFSSRIAFHVTKQASNSRFSPCGNGKTKTFHAALHLTSDSCVLERLRIIPLRSITQKFKPFWACFVSLQSTLEWERELFLE